jgi:hypothetical protein
LLLDCLIDPVFLFATSSECLLTYRLLRSSQSWRSGATASAMASESFVCAALAFD